MCSRLANSLLYQHGESKLNLEGRIGGDADLSSRGEEYARKLPELVRQSVGVCNPYRFAFRMSHALTSILDCRMIGHSRSGLQH